MKKTVIERRLQEIKEKWLDATKQGWKMMGSIGPDYGKWTIDDERITIQSSFDDAKIIADAPKDVLWLVSQLEELLECYNVPVVPIDEEAEKKIDAMVNKKINKSKKPIKARRSTKK